MKKTPEWQVEIQQIAKKHRGILRPVNIVQFAKDKNTALHSKFEWNNGKAAHEYRLWQAREIISVITWTLPREEKTCRAFVSLQKDRRKDGGGYRNLEAVMKNKVLRQEFLAEALRDLEVWQEKYNVLSELDSIFQAGDKVKAKVTDKRTKRAAVKIG